MSDFKTDALEAFNDYAAGEHTHAGFMELIEQIHKRHSVPDEPTEDMVRAGTGWREYDTDYYMGSNERNMVYRIYKAMIAAAKEE